jgi:hypothetical protein
MITNRTYVLTGLVVLIFGGLVYWLSWGSRGPIVGGGFFSDPGCRYDSALFPVPEWPCKKRCGPPYNVNNPEAITINGTVWHYCCPKGYYLQKEEDPITHVITGGHCQKDGT